MGEPLASLSPDESDWSVCMDPPAPPEDARVDEALYPDFWIFLRSLPTQTCCSSGLAAIRSMSLAVLGS